MIAQHADYHSTPENIRPLSGWALPVLLDIDETSPGFLRWVMQTSALRRQLCGLVAAEVLQDGLDSVGARLNPSIEPLKQIATSLVSSPARSVATAVMGDIPEGYMGALAKCGEQPFSKHDGYRMLCELLSNGGAERVAVLRQASSINYAALRSLSHLDPLLCKAGFVGKLRSMRQVRAANYVVKIAKEGAGAADESICASAKALHSPLAWVNRWIAGVKNLPLVPPPLGPEFRALCTPDDMRDAARRYKNCLKGRIASAVLGREVYVEHRDCRVLVELAPLTGDRYIMRNLWGPSNERPGDAVAKYIWQKMSEAGVLAHVARLQSGVVSGVLELAGGWDDYPPFFHVNDEDDE